MIEVDESKFMLRPNTPIEPLPKFGDRLQLRLSTGFRELILAQVNSVEDGIFTCTVVGVFDWDSKGEVTGGGVLSEFLNKDLRTDLRYVWKVVYADEIYRGKWASGVAIKYTNDLFDNILDVGLEEIYFSNEENEWVVTVGFRRTWDNPSTVLGHLRTPMQYRTYKKLRINNTSGEIYSVENRASDGGTEIIN